MAAAPEASSDASPGRGSTRLDRKFTSKGLSPVRLGSCTQACVSTQSNTQSMNALQGKVPSQLVARQIRLCRLYHLSKAGLPMPQHLFWAKVLPAMQVKARSELATDLVPDAELVGTWAQNRC